MDRDKLIRDFSYHPPNTDDIWKFEALRSNARNLALLIDTYVPDGREKSTAITNLEQAIFWANAGLARSQADSVDVIAGAMLEDNLDSPPPLPAPVPEAAREALANIQTLLAENQACGRKCKCQRF